MYMRYEYVHGVGGKDTWGLEGKQVSLPPGQLAYHPGRGMPGRGIYGRADVFRCYVGEPTLFGAMI